MMKEEWAVELPPMDLHNQTLVSNVHPPNWVNPTPNGRYHLVVIGAGTAGIVTAAGAAGLGAKVALIEKHFLGGDCLNYGCVPSKCLIRASRACADVREAGDFGVRVPPGIEIDFSAAMERMRALRAKISAHDSALHLQSQGIDVFMGQARFLNSDTVDVGGMILRFKKAVITTGARAVHPPIPGLAEAGFLTNETVFSLTTRPRRLACIGAGPIGCELAQVFRRFGCEVFLLDPAPHVLIREDADAAEIIQQAFLREGIQLTLNSSVKRVECRGDVPGGLPAACLPDRQGQAGGSGAATEGSPRGTSDSPPRRGSGRGRSQEKVIHYESRGRESSVVVDEILVGVGRSPNVEGLNLEAVGVQYDKKKGVLVNDHLQTTHPRIYAAGDICMNWKFTHAADAAARIVIENALFFGRKRLSRLIMPWCTYTEPEIAHVGLYESDAREAGVPVATFIKKFTDVDRAVADGEEDGFVKIHVRKGTDRILGATIVARHAGEMLNEISLAIVHKIGLGKIAGVIHPYPTQAEAVRQLGDAYNATRLTPWVKRLLHRWCSWTR